MNKMNCFNEPTDLLVDTLAGYERQVKIGDVVRHFKGGVYRVIAIGLSSDTLEPEVVYKNISDGRVWTRTYKEFVSYVPEKHVPRFENVESVAGKEGVQMNIPMTEFYALLDAEQKEELRQLVLVDAEDMNENRA